HQHVVAAQAVIPGEDVGRDGEPGHMADVPRAGGIGPGDGDQDSLRARWVRAGHRSTLVAGSRNRRPPPRPAPPPPATTAGSSASADNGGLGGSGAFRRLAERSPPPAAASSVSASAKASTGIAGRVSTVPVAIPTVAPRRFVVSCSDVAARSRARDGTCRTV